MINLDDTRQLERIAKALEEIAQTPSNINTQEFMRFIRWIREELSKIKEDAIVLEKDYADRSRKADYVIEALVENCKSLARDTDTKIADLLVGEPAWLKCVLPRPTEAAE